MNGRSADERRKAKRKNISLPVRVKVPLPEGGSATLVAKASIVNISPMGVGIRIHSLRKEHVPLLVETTRECILYFDLPGHAEPVVLQGDITWTDIKVDGNRASAYLGVRLDPVIQDGIQLLERMLKTMDETESAK